jgi:hypothetical protein
LRNAQFLYGNATDIGHYVIRGKLEPGTVQQDCLAQNVRRVYLEKLVATPSELGECKDRSALAIEDKTGHAEWFVHRRDLSWV